jgi:hypothetical protein
LKIEDWKIEDWKITRIKIRRLKIGRLNPEASGWKIGRFQDLRLEDYKITRFKIVGWGIFIIFNYKNYYYGYYQTI